MSLAEQFVDEHQEKMVVYLQEKLKEFEERDASIEEVDAFLAPYGYSRNE